MANKKHHLVYFDKETKQLVATQPKEWARAHKKLFPKYGFTSSKDSPRDVEIETLLKDKYRFVEFTFDEVVTLCNFDTKRFDF